LCFVTGCERVEREGAYFAGNECVDVFLRFVVFCVILFVLDVSFGCWVIFLKISILHLNDIIRKKNN